MPRLDNLQRAMLIGHIQNGATMEQAAARFNVHVSTVGRLLRKFNTHGDVKDRPRSGRPRATTQQEDNFVRTTAVRNRHITGNLLPLIF